jgi:hypothetical protein
MGSKDSDTAEVELPAEEPASVPATVYRVEPRLFGVASPALLGALSGVALLLSIVLYAVGDLAAGTVAFVLAVVLAGLFVVTATRDPRSALGRAVLGASAGMRAQARLAGVSLSAWSGAGREAVRLRRERWLLESRLRHVLRQLGEAVHRDEDERAAELKAEASALTAELERCDRELTAARRRAQRRVAGERLTSQRTGVFPAARSRRS